jgi:hypothetical protein
MILIGLQRVNAVRSADCSTDFRGVELDGKEQQFVVLVVGKGNPVSSRRKPYIFGSLQPLQTSLRVCRARKVQAGCKREVLG